MKNARCQNCHIIGHVARACRRFVKKDALRRLTTRVTDAPKGITVETREDRSAEDRVDMAANVFKLLKEAAQKRGQKNREKREQKKRASGWTPKRKLVEHPAACVEEMSSSETEDEEESSGDDMLYQGVEKMLQSAKMLKIQDEEEEAPPVYCEVVVNGREVICVADSGSGRSICSPSVAEIMGLEFTEA